MKDDRLISLNAAIDVLEKIDCSDGVGISSLKCDAVDDAVTAIKALPSAQSGCEDAVPRTSVEYICRKNTVSTNPYEHKYHDKFIQFMDDPEISDFGRWQHSNGFNTALVAVKCDLDKVPSVTPKQPGWIPCTPETMPKMTDTYLVQVGINENGEGMHTEVRTADWNVVWHEWYVHTTRCFVGDIIKWMPIPWEGGQDGV